jgi:hypothetical protein
MDPDPITIEDIQRATELGTRAVRDWIRRLSIVPVGVRGRVHLYPARVIPDIQAAQIQQSMNRRKGGSLTVTLEAAAASTGQTIITLDEAKRRAKGGRR